MSKDIIVVTPNGRRQKIHCTPDTSILQVLEDVCEKQGFHPSEYDLKHHNHILDLTTTVRFSNLPNKATLEMVETERKRTESNVTVGLLLEDGERRTADFAPNTSLYDLITSLAPHELTSLRQPTISYMRQEVVGVSALQEKTLRQLGLIGGRAVLRLLSKAEESRQANVSSVYRNPNSNKRHSADVNINELTEDINDNSAAQGSLDAEGQHDTFNSHASTQDKDVRLMVHPDKRVLEPKKQVEIRDFDTENAVNSGDKIDIEQKLSAKSNVSNNSITPENLERRLKIEEEVTFLGAQKAIAFMQPEELEDEVQDLPDDFYELTVEEVRKLYNQLQQSRLELENAPFLTTSKKEELDSQVSQEKINVYKNVVVRIQFPDHIILQGVFAPTDSIGDINNFIKEHLKTPDKPFHIFTTPLKESLDSKMTLLEAKFVPCVHMHFKWFEESEGQEYLKEEIYSKKTSSDAASILASKYRAPSRRKVDESEQTSKSNSSSSDNKTSKVPKWFKK